MASIGNWANGKSGFNELTQLFVTESPGFCSARKAALSPVDAAAWQREAHTVKSLMATSSPEEGACQAAQYLAAAGSLDGADRLAAQVIDAVRRLAAIVAKT